MEVSEEVKQEKGNHTKALDIKLPKNGENILYAFLYQQEENLGISGDL